MNEISQIASLVDAYMPRPSDLGLFFVDLRVKADKLEIFLVIMTSRRTLKFSNPGN